MGLLDGLLGNLLGRTADGGAVDGGGAGSHGTAIGVGQSALVMMALQMIRENGGLPGILGKLRQTGLGGLADSWVGTGANLPVSADQLSQVLGSGAIGRIAQQCGIAPGAAAGGLAQMLPQIINQLTPDGQVPGNHDALLEQAMAAFGARRQS